MGVQFFKGKFFHCQDANGDKLDCTVIHNRSECESNNYTWRQSFINFDNVGMGYVALMQVVSSRCFVTVVPVHRC